MSEKQLEKVLAWVNKIRKERFREKPLKHLAKGEIGSCYSCPIHNCFAKPGDQYVSVGDRETQINGEDIRHPKYVTHFVYAFDDGKYPNLVKRG